MTKQTMIATAASIFAATTFVASAASAQVMCSGTNACKGQSACKGNASPGKGQNACKGQGVSDTKDVVSCQESGRQAAHGLRSDFRSRQRGRPGPPVTPVLLGRCPSAQILRLS